MTSIFVDTSNPKNLSEAFDHALHAEEWQNYTEKARNAASSYHIAQPREFVSGRQRSLSPFPKQMDHLEEQVKSERSSSKWKTTTQPMPGPSPSTTRALMYTSMYNQHPLPYPPYQPNYQSQYPLSFSQYQLNYPYPPLYPAMMQCPPVEKGQKAPGSSSWQGQSKIAGSMPPAQSASPGPSGALNSQSIRHLDLVMSHSTIQERPKFVHFQEKSVGSFERDATNKTHQYLK